MSNVLKWYTWSSAAYALGVWTMIGSFFFIKYRRDPPEFWQDVEIEEENPNRVVYTSGNFRTVVVYKKDFVPYHTRISNFFNSFRSTPGPGDGNK